MDKAYLSQFVGQTNWYNDIVLGTLLPGDALRDLSHTAQGWLRNYIAGVLVYFISGCLWSISIYYLKRHVYFPNGSMPTRESILKQIRVTMKAMPLYTALPTFSEYLIENGWTTFQE